MDERGEECVFFFIDFFYLLQESKGRKQTHVKYSILKQNLHKEIKNIYILLCLVVVDVLGSCKSIVQYPT